MKSFRHMLRKKGFTMFFAVLVSSLALAIGLAIYDLVSRELALSSTTAQSEYAIYAADSGVECALYWDFKYNGSNSIFPTSTADTAALNASGAYCNGEDITAVRSVSTTGTSGFTTTTIPFDPGYVIISVQKTVTNSQVYLTPGSGGSITDSQGTVFTLPSDGCIYENGVQDPYGCGTSQLTYANATVWGQDASSGTWYTYDPSTGYWTASSGSPPAAGSATVHTVIYSQGFNTTATTSPNAVERELRVSY